MRLFLNNTCVSGASSHYNYKCYLEALTNFSPEVKTSILQGAGYFKDTYGEFNNFSSSNVGYEARQDLFSKKDGDLRVWNETSTYLVGPLFCDLDGVPGIYNGIKVKIEFRRAKQDFFLMGTTTDSKYVIEELLLHVPVGILQTDLALNIERRLQHGNMKLNFRRRNLIPFQIPKQSKSFYSDSE